MSALRAAVLLAAALAAPAAAQCVKQSPAHAVALLELYTSEGCNSCPPADRWLSGIAARGAGADQVVPLALHVDYWDRLGWPDRFANPRFTDRQTELSRRAGSRFIYTPGVFLNLRAFRDWDSSRFEEAVHALNARPARADIRLELVPDSGSVAVAADFRLRTPLAGEAYVALYENRLRTEVKAGENRGTTLGHDYVVREWIGPLALAPGGGAELRRTLVLRPGWKRADLGVAAFVQDRSGRDVLQATALALCRAS